MTKVKGDVGARARVRRRRMTDDGSQPATDWRTLTLLEGQRTEARRKNYSVRKKIFIKERKRGR